MSKNYSILSTKKIRKLRIKFVPARSYYFRTVLEINSAPRFGIIPYFLCARLRIFKHHRVINSHCSYFLSDSNLYFVFCLFSRPEAEIEMFLSIHVCSGYKYARYISINDICAIYINIYM